MAKRKRKPSHPMPTWLVGGLAAVLLVCTNWVPVVKKWHPIVFIGISALVGVLLKF